MQEPELPKKITAKDVAVAGALLLLLMCVMALLALFIQFVYVVNNMRPGSVAYALLVLGTGGVLGLFGWMSGVRKGWTLKVTIWFTIGCIALGALLMFYYQSAFLHFWFGG